MAEKTIRDMLISYIRDCHAMEANVLRMLDSMIATTNDAEILEDLRSHKVETETHERLLGERLEALGEGGTSSVKDVPAVFGAMLKGIADTVRTDKPGKNARDGYVTEAMEIAAYNLLENLAERAGDEVTVKLAQRIRADEEKMRDKIDQTWSKVIDLTLVEEGVSASTR